MKNFLKSVCFTYFLVNSLILAQDINVNAIRAVDGRAKTIMEYLHDDTRLVPTKVFDNVYCIGSVSVIAWAITTSDGIILIDSIKRAYSLYLTEKAKATIPKIKKYEEEFLKSLTLGIELEEAKIVDEILKKICKNISK